MPARKVLVVEDDHSLCDLISIAIRREGLEADCTDDADEAIAHLGKARYSVVVLDLVLRASSGLYVVSAIRRMPAEQRPRVIVITGTGSDTLKSIDRSVVKAILFKPLDLKTFAPFVRIEAERPPAGAR